MMRVSRLEKLEAVIAARPPVIDGQAFDEMVQVAADRIMAKQRGEEVNGVPMEANIPAIHSGEYVRAIAAEIERRENIILRAEAVAKMPNTT